MRNPLKSMYASFIRFFLNSFNPLFSLRDLKPENVVFFEKLGMVKLTDFGFSNKFDPGQRLQTSCGSLAYSAPEILLGMMIRARFFRVIFLMQAFYLISHPFFHSWNHHRYVKSLINLSVLSSF